MGNSLSSSAGVVNHTALNNADKADGGFTPQPLSWGVDHQTTLQLRERFWTQASRVCGNGPAVERPSSIRERSCLPDKQANQITETEFLDVVAEELARGDR